MTKPEILAPGGSPESIYSAINAGCDAIYAGGRRFGARAFADNQDNDSLIEILNNIHLAGKKLYLTVNTILTQRETFELYDYLSPLYEKGLDAVIVQDLGVLKFIHKEFPQLQIHASTQMSITGGMGANFIMPYGVTRVVPARELSFEEIKQLRRTTSAEIEVFVHGALCSSYSGQCLMSSLIGGRSGNRGACAQPCRKKYSLNGLDMEYSLSLKDLCTLEHMPLLVQSGIDSFKIEGRMKKPEYVAITTHMYRKYLDIYMDKGEKFYNESVLSSKEFSDDMKALRDIYNRGGFTSAYLIKEKDKSEILSGNRPNHEGVVVGYVNDVYKKGVSITFTDTVNSGDILEIRDKSGNKVHDYTPGTGYITGDMININAGYNNRLVKKGMQLFRVRNNKLIDELLTAYPVTMCNVPVEGELHAVVGKPLQIVVRNQEGTVTTSVYGNEVKEADRHPADEEYIKSKVMVKGNSDFAWSNLNVHLEGNAYISPSELKNIRRQVLAEHRVNLLVRFRNELAEKSGYEECVSKVKSDSSVNIIAECNHDNQLNCLLENDNVNEIYIQYDLAESVIRDGNITGINKTFYIVLPRIIRSKIVYQNIEKSIRLVKETNNFFKGIVVCTLCQINFFASLCNELGLVMDSYDNLYVRNSYANSFLKEEGIYRTIASIEMSEPELKELNTWNDGKVIITVYGKPAAMITDRTPRQAGTLKDSYGNIYTVVDRNEYNEIVSYEPVNRIDSVNSYKCNNYRVLFTDENEKEIKTVLEDIRRQLY
ncbi:MAG: U32 family peptidase [Lachnospiraceae bacterium]|nr:U32 family peptidase [Lachnospiraceae bacterium]